jgi:hypothetical protein
MMATSSCRTGIFAGAIFLSVALLSGCGTPSSVTSSDTASPALVVTQQQAADIVHSYDSRNNKVNAALDAAGIPAIETLPLSTASEAWLRITQQLHQTVPVITSSNLTFYLPPSETSYPHWFLVTSTRVRGGVPDSQPTYTIYQQQAPSAPWLAAYSMKPTGQVPAIARSGDGGASAITTGPSLPASAQQLSNAILAHYTDNLAGKDQFAHTEALDGQLSAGYLLGKQVLGQRGTSLSRTLDSVAPEVFALRTADGGALIFTSNVVMDTLEPASPTGTVSLSAGSNDAAQLGQPGGATAKKFSISRLETFLTYVPRNASSQKTEVLAYTEVSTSVDDLS